MTGTAQGGDWGDWRLAAIGTGQGNCPAHMTIIPVKLRRRISFSHQAGIEKKNVAPRPSSDSTQMRPPYRSTNFLQIAKPMPVPE